MISRTTGILPVSEERAGCPLYGGFLRILGIDPGLKLTGYGVIDCRSIDPTLVAGGVIRLNDRTSLSDRLVELETELESLKSRHCATRDMDVAILSGSESHLHKSLSTPTHSFFDLSAKAAVPDFRALAGVHLAVKSGRTLAAGLLFKLEGGERPCSETIAALADHRPVRV